MRRIRADTSAIHYQPRWIELRAAVPKSFARMTVTMYLLSLGASATAEELHIEPGLWEVSYTYLLQGEPPAAVLIQLPPEKRDAVEKAWASRVGHSKTNTSKNCVTAGEIAAGTAFENDHHAPVRGCERSYTTQTAARWTMVEHCDNEAGVSERNVQINASGPHSVDGTMNAVHGEGAAASGLDMAFRGKWLAKSCGNVP
jgi:hypothetical protein